VTLWVEQQQVNQVIKYIPFMGCNRCCGNHSATVNTNNNCNRYAGPTIGTVPAKQYNKLYSDSHRSLRRLHRIYLQRATVNIVGWNNNR
jgi:hypothetical protein